MLSLCSKLNPTAIFFQAVDQMLRSCLFALAMPTARWLVSSERTARPDCKCPYVSVRADEGLAVQAATGSGW